MSRLSRLASLSATERRDLLRAQLALLRAQLIVWTRAPGRLVRPDARPSVPPDERSFIAARRLAVAIAIASRRGVFRPTCLVRALALSRMLAREGVPGWRVRIGVRERTGKFEAHAWVEVGTEVLADSSQHVASFERLTDVQPVGVR